MRRARLASPSTLLYLATALGVAAPAVANAESALPATLSMRTVASRTTPAPLLGLPRDLRGVIAWLLAQPEEPAEPAPADPAAPAEPADPATPAEPAAPADEGTAMPTDEELVRQAEAEAAAQLQGQEQGGEVIQVTGSAIERTETTTSAPVTVLDRTEIDAAGVPSIGDVLQDLPAQSNAINTQANNGGDGSTRVDLRGLGSGRTLVLVNGRRYVAGGTGADSSVDLNSIPLAIIERIEVLKDGASAVYGSDAIGGVVNIITRKNFEGAEASVYTGTTHRGGGTNYDLNFVAGQAGKRGNVVFSAGFFDQRDVFADQRTFSNPQRVVDWACIADPTITDKSTCESQSGSSATPEGTIVDYDDPALGPVVCPSGTCFNDNGTWRDLDGGGNSDTGTGDLYNFQPDNYLLTPQRRYNVWSNGDYRLHDNVRAFFEASFVNRQSSQRLAPEPLFTINEGIVASADSVYNPFGKDIIDVRKRMVETGPRNTLQDVNTFRLVTGFDGKLPFKGWKWETSYNFGRTEATSVNEGNLVRPNVAEALGPSFIDENGVAQCGTPDNPSQTGCVPLDLFGGVGSVTPEMIKFISYTGVARGFNKQHTLLAQVSGPVAKLPNNGDIVAAAGVDYRREAGGFQPDPLTATGNTTGNKVEPTNGNYDVREGFAELSIVPVAGKPWAKWLELNGAARVVDYSSFGTNATWKAGALYKAPFGLAVRGTVSTAFRAPSVAALYSGQVDDFPSVTDPCSTVNGQLDNPIVAANCADDQANGATAGISSVNDDLREQLPARAGGNPKLEPESANVFTAGLVYEPTFAEGLSFTLDYFQVKIDSAIQSAGANILLANCYATTDRQDCDKITRGGGGLITEISDLITNIGSVETKGVDAGIGYTYETRVGRFRHDLEGTFLRQYDSTIGDITTKGVGYYDLGVFPRFKGNLNTMWGMGQVGAGLNVRYIHGFRECDGDDCSGSNASRRVDANVTSDVYATYDIKSPLGKSLLSVGVNNVLDQDPPDIYNGFLATSDSNTYDYLGRYYYLRLAQAF